jgi:hypothetical protein
MDHGIKISKGTFDVKTAAKENLEMSSKYPMFKIFMQGNISVDVYKTTLSGAMTAIQNTVPLTATTGFPSSVTSGKTMFVLVDPGLLNAEYISYTNISGSSLTGAGRNYDGITGAFAHAAGATVIVGYVENYVSTGLPWPSVHMVHWLPGTGRDSIAPVFAGNEPYFEYALLAFAMTGKVYVAFELGNLAHSVGASPPPAGAHDTYTFRYVIMADSITSPYYG